METLISIKAKIMNSVQENVAKKTDVHNLVKKHFYRDWRNLSDLDYYKI